MRFNARRGMGVASFSAALPLSGLVGVGGGTIASSMIVSSRLLMSLVLLSVGGSGGCGWGRGHKDVSDLTYKH